MTAGGSLAGGLRTFTVALLAIAVVVSTSLGTTPVSVTVWCGSVPSSQLKTPASQWPLQRTSSMHCPTRRPSSCQPQLHKRKLSDQRELEFGGALVFAGSLLRVHGPLVRVFPVTAWWAPETDCIATGACTRGFAGVMFGSFKSVAWYAAPLTKNDLRKFRARSRPPGRRPATAARHAGPGTRQV